VEQRSENIAHISDKLLILKLKISNLLIMIED
jgi:hypothetical protein